jgi:poly-gamma-glutamate capsule biosynthesis protein CapA/YwtB (metallophosphatase superfamily)
MLIAVVAYLAMEPASYAAGSGVPGAATWAECKAEKQIRDLAASGYFVVAALHLHLGYSMTDRTDPANLAAVKRAMAAGADLAIATGPHIPQGIVTDQNRVALLGLGDFLFHPDYKLHRRPERSVVAEVTISRSQIEVALVPLKREENGRPVRPAASEAADTLARIAERSAELGSAIAIRDGVGYVSVRRRR